MIYQDTDLDPESDGIRNSGGEYVDYPFDLWFILARYICPEDVGKFAMLCRNSAAVLNSMSYWIQLYNRQYNICYEHCLPNMLRPVNIQRPICLRMNVIRALYHMYSPFRERSIATDPNIHPKFLIGRICVLVWHEVHSAKAFDTNSSAQWRYYFKLKDKSRINNIAHVSDLWRNPEEGCKLLQIVSMNFVLIPSSIETLVLMSLTLKLTPSLRNYKLELQFGSEVTAMNASHNMINKRPAGSVIVLDPVVSFAILDWWHPNYPHASTQYDKDKTLEEPLSTWDQ